MWYVLESGSGATWSGHGGDQVMRAMQKIVLALCAIALMSTPPTLHAQEGVSLTVTPPLYQMTVNPGEVFSSSITVVNANAFPLPIYIEPVGFSVRGERGEGVLERFDTIGDREQHLAGWVTLTRSEMIIPAGQSTTIPFTIDIPLDASPGGHYAALLVGTQPPRPTEGSALTISSSIASLVLMRVKGEVIEQGIVREFSTERALYQKPEAHFSLRFQNTGNTHLLPSGMISIYNMWGTERGSVPINQQTDFGNVLPNSIRAFTFTWKSDENLYDFGRYRAVATLSFGDEARQNVTRETTFWVVPVGAFVRVVGGGLLLFGLLFYLVRRYIRYALMIETAQVHREVSARMEDERIEVPPPATPSVATMLRPLTMRAVDLRAPASIHRDEHTDARAPAESSTTASSVADSDTILLIPPLWKRALWAAAFLLLCAVTIYFVRAYFASVFTYERAYEVNIEELAPELPVDSSE